MQSLQVVQAVIRKQGPISLLRIDQAYGGQTAKENT